MSAFGGGAPKCKRCLKSAYKAESVNAIGATWHRTCFTCEGCGKGLGRDVANARDHGGMPWCRGCYAKAHGPKGIGYGNTLGDTGLGGPPASTATFAPAKRSYEEVNGKVSTGPPIDKDGLAVQTTGSFSFPQPSKSVSVSGARSVFEKKKPSPSSGGIKARFGGAPKCKRCLKSAYKAESVNAIGATWHRTCFTCEGCGKGLGRDAANARDHGGMPWCRGCYAKAHGPKGIGFGNTLGDTGIEKAQ